MKPNIVLLTHVLNTDFCGKKAAFANELNINRSQLSLILNNDGKGAGTLFYGNLIAFCDRTGRDFRDFIILPTNENILTPKVDKPKSA